jgi:hypothetical protein
MTITLSEFLSRVVVNAPIVLARGGEAKTQLKTTNAIGADELNKSKSLENQLVPGYTSLMNTGYLSPDEEHAATTSEMGAATAPFSTADFQARNTAGATRNAADLTANQDTLALEKGRTAGDAAANLQKEKMSNQEAGMYGLGELKSQDQAAMESMYGLGPPTLNAEANLQNAGWQPLQFLGQAMGAAGTAYAGAQHG